MGAFLTGDFGSLYFDLTVSEFHQGNLVITEKPVERGAPIADNARAELDKVQLVVFVSSSPQVDLPDGSRGGKATDVQLDVPVFSPPFTPTPGAVFGAIGDAVRSLFADPSPSKNKVLMFGKEYDAREDTERALRKIQDTKALVTVVTSFRSYKSMILESFEMPVDEDSCDGATITLNFRHIRVIDTKIVNAPKATEPRGQKAKQKGKKDTIPPDDAKKSILLAAVQGAGLTVPGVP